MVINRRSFIRQAGMASAALMAAPLLRAQDDEVVGKLTILHTNDVHSRLDPFPNDGSRNAGLGGVSARSALIRRIRSQAEQVLLVDAGDMFQGTPYFNVYKGEPEIKAMSMMGYDAATMGNHDFDGGVDNFAAQLAHATFPIVICNYDFSGTAMEGKSVPYRVFQKGNIKVGVTGLGIELRGLVPENLSGKTRYLDPVICVNEVAENLKKKERCDFVICLSHLGDRYDDDTLSDAILARESYEIDVIIGAHTHRFFEQPRKYKNRKNSDVIVNQVGWGGLNLGRLDFVFERSGNKNLVQSHTVVVGKKTSD
ncbi:MAG TPA: metallophosphatase [Chitinophagaceae bacterium]